MTTPDAPLGFRESNGGLLVPEAVSRDEETWTNDDWLVIRRAARLAVAKGLVLRLFCPHERCRANAMVDMVDTPTGRVLACEHKIRRLYQADAIAANRQARADARRATRAAREQLRMAKAQMRQPRATTMASGAAADTPSVVGVSPAPHAEEAEGRCEE